MIKDLLKKARFFLIVVLVLSVHVPANAQDSEVGRRIVIDGKEYFLHVVQQGQGFYSIARQYNVSQQEILEANDNFEDGLKKGQVIRIPVIEGRNDSQHEINRSNDYILHTVEKGQTAWYIAQKYNVDVEDIYRHNPGSEKQLVSGSIIKVPVSKQKIDKSVEESDFKLHKVQPGETLYSLSQRYHMSVNNIVDNNPALKTGVLSVGSVVRIPKSSSSQLTKTDSSSESDLIKGEDFIYHEIKDGQTLYSISRLYQVDVDQIKKANSDVDANDLEPGNMLRVPREKKERISQKQEQEKDKLFESHRVRRKETLFSISREYDVDMETIRKVNPDIDFSNLKRGTELKIPNDQWFVQQYPGRDSSEEKADQARLADSLKIQTFLPSDSLCVNYEGIGKKRPIRVALLLPFALDETEEANILKKISNGDTIKTTRKNPVIARQSQVFAEFYEGALLALDKLKDDKVNVDISVYDIAPNSAMVERVLKNNPDLKDVDIIIGPARSADLEPVSRFAIEHEIKVVYPLSNKNPELDRNPYIFQVNTPDTLVFGRMTNEIIKQSEGSNLLVVIPEGEDEYATSFMEELRQKVFFNEFSLDKNINYREYKMTGREDQTNLEALMDPLKKNYIVVPTNQEATISKIVPTLAGISRNRDIDISLFGMTEWLRAQSIEPEDMFTLNAQIFTFFALDYENSDTRQFIEKYRRWYHTEPHAVSSYFQSSSSSSGYSRYGAWGYDVTYYFLSAMARRGAHFEYCPEPFDLSPVQFNFSFKRISNWGGFYNDGIFLLKFLPEYKIERVPVLTLQPMMSVEPTDKLDNF